MEHISKTLEAVQNGLQTNATKSQGETSSKTDLPIHWISALFKRFQARYGHKWVSAMDGIEEFAIKEWARGLGGLNGEQISKGLDLWIEDWPPTLPEFRKLCEGRAEKLNEFGLNYIPEYYRQPEMRKDRLLSNDEREAKREIAINGIKNLKQTLKKI